MSQSGISKQSEDFQFHQHVISGDGEYVYPEVSLNVELDAFGDSHTVVYQTGVSCVGGDINRPSTELEIDDAAGTSKAIAMINSGYIDQDFVDDIAELSPSLNTVERVEAMKDFLDENQPDIRDYMSAEDLQQDPDAYRESAEHRTVRVKQSLQDALSVSDERETEDER